MINDLGVSDVKDQWKYVDDSTMSECVEKDNTSAIQKWVDEFAEKSSAGGFDLKESKCKELHIGFSLPNKDFQPIKINGKDVEVVKFVEILGLTISDDLKWNPHILKI